MAGNIYTADSGVPVGQSNPLPTTMASALSKDIDSVDVGKMSKGGASATFTTTITGTSNEIPCVGFNSVIVHISALTGTWDVALQGSVVSAGTYVDAYDSATQMKAAGITGGRAILFRGVLDYVKVVATNVAAGSVTIKVVPLNL